MKRSKSPCINVCEFSGPNGWCLGCGRTRRECDKWKKMKPYERHSLHKQLVKRMAEIRGWCSWLENKWIYFPAILLGRAANALHDQRNHVDLEPSEHAGRRNLRRKGQKRDARWRCQTAPGRPEWGSKLEQKWQPFRSISDNPSISPIKSIA